MAPILLITGGARSGKSRRAETHLTRFPGAPVYIATATADDDEMAERIALHRASRPAWETVEAPLDLVCALTRTDGQGARLVDCLTLWLSNLMAVGRDWRDEAGQLAKALAAQRAPVVLVTNEVGLGIVPDNALAREFRDAQGWLNQAIAEQADQVVLVVAGQELKVKG